MGFFEQVREGREAARSKREYAECYKARQEKLRSFRENMIVEILFKYPDANLLMTSLSREFQVSLKNRGGLLLGEFADEYCPRLDYVADTASTSDRRDAVVRFRHDIDRCEMKFLEDGYCGRAKSLRSKGFAITGSIELRYLLGGALFLNGKQIAKASVRHPKPNGYFSAKLFDEVLQCRNRGAGIQSLIFVTTVFDYALDEQRKMSHEILFDHSLQQFDENNRREFRGAILNLRDFICDIEDYFRLDCPMAPNDRDEDWLRISEDTESLLDSPDRDKCGGGNYPFRFDRERFTVLQ
jgi:hypothetical protein